MGNIQYRQRETGAVVAATAPLVVTLVRVRRIELLDEVGVGAVNFDAVKTGEDRATDAVAKLGDHPFHFFTTERSRHSGALTRSGDGARRHRLAATDQLRVDHTAAVVDLQNRF
ncbi:Uncharacterised protein [Klebsiella quasivariicola]|nr:Uncharacterised protein [Klebsiella quasivariicola]